MIVDTVLGNLAELTEQERSGLHLERIALSGTALRKRVQRVVTDHGTEVGIRLAQRQELKDGDILHREGTNAVVISSLPTDVLVVAPATIEQMGFVAHSLGNRHLPAQFLGPDTEIPELPEHDGLLLVQYDHTAEAFLERAGVRFARVERQMEAPFRHAEHTH
ncbi:Urease accessory protein UreE [Kocuria rosea subsp. polaris]|uniref:Urease accessory protein UreE n=1 Tax=Kocuria rosea subsp. polaris TaxID=136273 RepID=A0A0W8I8Y8_KOCRO|nr:urease accessory protein UreE [Kocuria polaris]KUG56275.1 Urease accessory protein UreE [Kocuria polaris]